MMKMGRTVTIFLAVLLLTGKQSFSQVDKLKTLDKFYMTEWLFETPETIQFFETRDSIPQSTRYSVVRRIEKNNYDLDCWTEQWNSLESPTKVKGKFTLKFNKNGQVKVRIGTWCKATYAVIGNRLELKKK